MKLQNIVEPADLIFVQGSGWISNMIQKTTFSNFSHVGIIASKDKVFETDIKWGKASFRDLDKYNQSKVVIVRSNDICKPEEILDLCKKYDKTPYSFWDILTNFFLAPFKDEIRKKIVALIGTKKYAICSELTARIFYEASGMYYLRGYEGYTPQDLFTICQTHSESFQVVLSQVSLTQE